MKIAIILVDLILLNSVIAAKNKNELISYSNLSSDFSDQNSPKTDCVCRDHPTLRAREKSGYKCSCSMKCDEKKSCLGCGPTIFRYYLTTYSCVFENEIGEMPNNVPLFLQAEILNFNFSVSGWKWFDGCHESKIENFMENDTCKV